MRDKQKLKKVKKSEKNSKKKRKSRDKVADHLRLLALAELGDVQKVQGFLDSHGSRTINLYDADGCSALHQAARRGHADVVECLIRHGADARAEDFQGNTPAHFAAERGHLVILPLLLQADPPPNIDAKNAAGISVRDLTNTALAAEDKGNADEKDEWEKLMEEDGVPECMEEQAERYDSEEEWEQRLREEGMADKAAEHWGWGSGGWWEGAGGAAQEGEEDEDAYAQRIWEQMERRKRAAPGASAAAQQQWGAADEAAERRQANARQAEERSRRILEEERAREAAWRQAVLKGNVGARRAAYEARWHSFGAAIVGGKSGLTYKEVPWPADDPEDVKAIILYGADGSTEVRKRVRLELLRWHEDKFARFRDKLADFDRQRILERVKIMTQLLNSIASEK